MGIFRFFRSSNRFFNTLAGVNKAISIFFMCVYLFGATALNQVLRVPLLVQHYGEFQKDNPGYGFGTFMRVHYMYPQPLQDSDYAKDMSLPFKSVDLNYLITAAGCLVPQPYYFSAPKLFLPVRNFPVYNELMHSFIHSYSIFQPPKA